MGRVFKRWGRCLACSLVRFLISLRYRVVARGLKQIKTSPSKGILFLPNHPAEIDPVLLILVLWPRFEVCPLVIEHFYYQWGLHFFMRLVNALPLPSMDIPNQWKARQIEKLKVKIVSEIDKGKSFLIYPSGKLKRTGKEQLGGTSLVSELLNLKPDLDVVLVRTRGLWGSIFSRAITGTSPDFGSTLWQGFKILLKNALFFTPRRKITIDFQRAPDAFPRHGEKMEINRYLESWYNALGTEPLQLVSMAFWKKEYPEILAQKIEALYEEVSVPEEVRVQIFGYLAKQARCAFSDLQPHVHLANDLGLDSLDMGQLYLFLEERFDLKGLIPGQLQTIFDVLQAASGGRQEEGEEIATMKKSKWPRESLRLPPFIAEGETIQEVFLNSCERMADQIACADALSGIKTYKQLKRAVLILALEIQKMPGESIGILLPSSTAAYVAILATLFAQKVPVMLNWTTGFRNIEHAADICCLQTVISSFRFLSRVEGGDLGKVDDLLILLEKVREKLPFMTKLKGVFLSFAKPQKLLKRLDLSKDPQKRAVVIFTSGTETLPKGVPLSHKNILSNQRSAFRCISFSSNDSLHSVLPPFHSFGFSVTGLFPLLSGMKVSYAPDPTDSRGLANDIEHWRPTLFFCAPSFVAQLIRVADETQIDSLRMVVMGAEKVPQELYDTLKAKGKVVIEGYGISECSPIVTMEREGDLHTGVGRPLPGIFLSILDPETGKVLKWEEEGEVCISGPSVFSGYIYHKIDPFIEIGGTKWYRSGDRGRILPDGTLFLTGRLKRFVKIGGEMISLGGLEEDVLRIGQEMGRCSPAVGIPSVAVISSGRESEKPHLICYVTFSIQLGELNGALRQMGHGRLIRFKDVYQLEEIPLTGTGKAHYRMLEEML